MKRKLLGLLLSFCMAAALLPGTAFAAEEAADTWNGTVDTSWYDPNDIKAGYEILTAEELAGLALLVMTVLILRQRSLLSRQILI